MDQGTGRADAAGAESVTDAVTAMYQVVNDLALPLDVPGARVMRTERERTLRLLESYVMPRIGERQPAPLVVVIGGPTGAGKSTLTNSLIGADVSPSSVLRPTTREPVLVYNPADARALHQLGLVRHRDEPAAADASRWVTMRAVPNEDIVPGLAIIDSPDLDSRVDGNRELAAQLLLVADLWLFVTTGTDYADAMSWELLHEATERRVSVAVLLNRLRPREADAVRAHFATQLTEAGLAHAHVFTVPEVTLVDDRLPVRFVLSLQQWLERQATAGQERQAHTERAFDGTVDQAVSSARLLADAAADQVVAARRLRVDLEVIFSRAREEVETRCADGSLFDEDVVAAWAASAVPHEVVAPAAPSGLFRRRSRGSATMVEDPSAAWVVVAATLREAVNRLMREQVSQALFRVSERWGSHPASSSVEVEQVAELPADFGARVDEAAGQWLAGLHSRMRPLLTTPTRPGEDPADPLTLAVATLSVDGLTGRSRVEGVDGAREQVRAQLAGCADPDAAHEAARDTWLDLVALLYSVMAQEESRLSAVLDAAHVSPEATSQLRAVADRVANARSAQEALRGQA